MRAAAQARWPVGDDPVEESVTFALIYFYDRVSPDVDNIIKPIQDSLENLVYVDDGQIVDTRSQKRSLSGSYRSGDVTPLLSRALASGREFVYVKVDVASDLEEIRI